MNNDKVLKDFEDWLDQVIGHKQNKQWGFYDGVVVAKNKLQDFKNASR